MEVAAFPMEVRGVGVFSLSNAPSAPLLARGCALLARVLGGVPLRCACQTVGGPRRLAGNDALRCAQFHALLDDPETDLLVAARGGFGVTRLLEQLDFPRLKASGKALCGYSDVSALLVAAWSQGCRRLLHGPMICSTWALEDSPALAAETDSFLRTLRGEWKLTSPGFTLETLRPGTARGPVLPVNLTMLISLLGTPFQPDLQGAILLLEDVHEPAHAIERMLVQLRSAGILKRLAGLILGQFSQGEDAHYLPEIFREAAQWVPGPVVAGYPLGHHHPSLTCPVGAWTTLEAKP